MSLFRHIVASCLCAKKPYLASYHLMAKRYRTIPSAWVYTRVLGRQIMQPTTAKFLGVLLAALLGSGVALAQSQDSSGQAAAQSAAQDPSAAPAPLPPPPQPVAPPQE